MNEPDLLGTASADTQPSGSKMFTTDALGNICGEAAIWLNICLSPSRLVDGEDQKRRVGSGWPLQGYERPARSRQPFKKAITTRQFSSVPSNNVEWLDPL